MTSELIEKAKGYLDTCIDTPIFTDKGALAYVEVSLPTLAGMALYLDINKDTIQSWCKEQSMTDPDMKALQKEFSVQVTKVLHEQETRVVNNGLGGLYNPKIGGLILGRYGYTEKTETDITTQGEKIGSPVLPEVLAEADRLLKERKLKKHE